MQQECRWETTARSNNLFRNSPKPSQQFECLSRTGLCSGMAGESSPCWHIPQWKRTGSWLREDEVSCPYLPISENHIFPFVKLLKQAGFLQLKPVVFPQRLSASLCPTWTVRCICGMISFCTTRDRNSRNRAEFTPSPPPQCSG